MRITRFLILSITLAACAGSPDATECVTGITCPEGTKCAAAQAICLNNDCGDGIQQSNEVCDDGNILDGDGCAANCGSREECGDNTLNAAAGELCDDGNTIGGDGCADDCRSVEICGNGVRDITEACDDGNTVPGDGCSGNCKSTEICGNSVLDINEKCDDGATPGGCNPDCQGGTGCGDGAIDRDGSGNALEECDDGNVDNQDDCTNLCNLNTCGDGIVQTSGARVEDCDPSVNFGETATCNLDCSTCDAAVCPTFAMCGDGKINNAAGEECDDALLNGDDRDCTASCRVNVCGDTHANTIGPSHIEQCDDGFSTTIDNCSNQCTMPTCGNGVREGTEACDDFNLVNGDGCSSLCVYERCGDGIINDGEACDGTGTASVMGTPGETATCNIDCTRSTPMCGDGKVNKTAGEECDDQNLNDANDTCRNNCKLNICGDGQKSPSEGCDDGNQINTDACNNDCALQTCGDAILQGTEICDDGIPAVTPANGNLDGCLNTCVLPTCGDGFIRAGVEQCDNGLTTGNGPDKDCTATCQLNVCGDGFVDTQGTGASQTESCDDGNTDTETACPYGVATCTRCRADCDAVINNLVGNVCGDGNSASPEVCDDGNAITEATCPYNSPGGACNVCNSTCTALVARTNGAFCGDGVVNNGEVCDDYSPTQSCGLCSNGCSVVSTVAPATGFLLAPIGSNSISIDGNTFTINDGFGHVVTFELDTNNTFTMTNTQISIPNMTTATVSRDTIQAAINSSTLDITATDLGGAGLLLTNQHPGARGNVAIQVTGSPDADEWFVTGMSGGAGRDCAVDVGCKSGSDCLSGNCGGDNLCN